MNFGCAVKAEAAPGDLRGRDTGDFNKLSHVWRLERMTCYASKQTEARQQA